MARRQNAFAGAAAVVLGSLLLAAATHTGAAAPVAPTPPPAPAVLLIVGDRSNPVELIRLLFEVAGYDKMTAARYVAQADAARRRGEAPVVRIPMPSIAAAEAIVRAVPGAGAAARVETPATGH